MVATVCWPLWRRGMGSFSCTSVVSSQYHTELFSPPTTRYTTSPRGCLRYHLYWANCAAVVTHKPGCPKLWMVLSAVNNNTYPPRKPCHRSPIKRPPAPPHNWTLHDNTHHPHTTSAQTSIRGKKLTPSRCA